MQQKFAKARRKQKLQMQATQPPGSLIEAVPALKEVVTTPASESAKSLRRETSRSRRRARRATEQQPPKRKSKKAKPTREAANKGEKGVSAREAARRLQQALDEAGGEKLSASPPFRPMTETTKDEEPAKVGLGAAEEKPTEDHSESGSLSEDGRPSQEGIPTALESPPRETKHSKNGGNVPRKVASKVPNDQEKGVETQDSVKSGTNRIPEAERKAELARKLGLKTVKHATKESPEFGGQTAKTTDEAVVAFAKKSLEQTKKLASKSTTSGKKLSDVAGFDSLQSTLGGKPKKAKSPIERADATKLEILRTPSFLCKRQC